MAVSGQPSAGAPRHVERVASERPSAAAGPVAGVAAIVLVIVGGLVLDGTTMLDENAAPREYVAYFRDETDSIWGGWWLISLGVICFLWFAGSVRSRLARAEGAAHGLASLAMAGATAMAVLLLVPWVGWAAFLFLLPLWIVAMAVLLWRGSREPVA